MRILLFIFVVIPFGCSQNVIIIDEQTIGEKLRFLQVGQTTKEQVFFMIGKTNYEYEKGSVLIYKLCLTPDGEGFQRKSPYGEQCYRTAISFKDPSEYDLVLLFRTDGVLESFRLIQVE